jgi:hypothetical protein
MIISKLLGGGLHPPPPPPPARLLRPWHSESILIDNEIYQRGAGLTFADNMGQCFYVVGAWSMAQCRSEIKIFKYADYWPGCVCVPLAMPPLSTITLFITSFSDDCLHGLKLAYQEYFM